MKKKLAPPGFWGDFVAMMRRKRRIDQATLAKALGIKRPYLSAIENGHSQPSLALVVALAEYFKLPIALFFGDARLAQPLWEDLGKEIFQARWDAVDFL